MHRPPPSFREDASHLLRGLMMGAADVVPGVSGGTMALVLGVYERLVTAISHFDGRLIAQLRQRCWREAAGHVDLRFLAALGCGIVLSVVTLASVMHYLLEHHQAATLGVFFGLIAASSLLVARMVGRLSGAVLLLGLAGAAFAFWLTGLVQTQRELQLGYLFVCGMVAICAMILPGISGAYILRILGVYTGLTGVVRGVVTGGGLSGEVVLIVLVFAAGCSVGLLGFSKLLRWLLAHHQGQTMAVLFGFMVGSLRNVWPFKENDVNVLPAAGAWLLPAALAVGAAAFVLLIDYAARVRKGARTLEPHLEEDEDAAENAADEPRNRARLPQRVGQAD